MKRKVKTIAKKKMLTANLEEYVKFLTSIATNNNALGQKLSQG
jgi:hypothetical protein